MIAIIGHWYRSDGGEYHDDADLDQVICSMHGSVHVNRRHSRQKATLGGHSSFAQLLSKIDRITALLRFDDEALMAAVESSRRQAKLLSGREQNT